MKTKIIQAIDTMIGMALIVAPLFIYILTMKA
jgi:hypothetical protein